MTQWQNIAIFKHVKYAHKALKILAETLKRKIQTSLKIRNVVYYNNKNITINTQNLTLYINKVNEINMKYKIYP